MDPVVHFEMPYQDKNRMADFYKKVFGWKTEILGPEMGNYVLAGTTETDEKQMIKKPGRINSGFFERSKDNEHPSVVISVQDIRASMKKVTEAGGRIVGGSKLGEPDMIPGIGLYISFIDTEGNRGSLLEPPKA